MQLRDGTNFRIIKTPLEDGVEIDVLVITFADGAHYRIIDHIASGLYGHIFLVECCVSKRRCALKVVPAPALQDRHPEMKLDFQAQRELWFHFFCNSLKRSEPLNVVQAYWYWRVEGVSKQEFLQLYKECLKAFVKQPDTLKRRIKDYSPETASISIYFVLMPFYPLSTLAKRLSETSLSYELKVLLFIDILRGIAFLHAKGLIHRGICPANILLHRDNEQDRIHAIIGGFGRIISCGENAEWRLSNTNGNFSRRHEADPFVAPEVKGMDYDQKCDCYSVGVIALQMFWDLHTNNDIVDAILDLQNKGSIVKKDNPLLRDKLFWLDVIIRQIVGKKEQRYSCTELLQKCKTLAQQKLRLEIRLPTPELPKEVKDNCSAQSVMSLLQECRPSTSWSQDCNIADKVNQTPPSIRESSSTMSLRFQSSFEGTPDRNEIKRSSLSPSTPSLGSPSISQSFVSVEHRCSDQSLKIEQFMNANILPKGDQWIRDQLEKGQNGNIWRLLLEKLNVKAVALHLTKLNTNCREELIQEYHPKSLHEKVWSLFQQLRGSEDGAYVEFVTVLVHIQPDLAKQIFIVMK